MSNRIKDEEAFIRTLRRCISKNWYRVTVTDEAKAYKYEITITPIKIRSEE